jgi:hypothetical protein
MVRIKCLVFSVALVFIMIGSGISQTPDAKTMGRITKYLKDLEAVGFSGSVLVEIGGKEVLSKVTGLETRRKNAKYARHYIRYRLHYKAIYGGRSRCRANSAPATRSRKYFGYVPADKASITHPRPS